MSTLFEDLKEGLQEAIDYEKGNKEVKTTVIEYDEEENEVKSIVCKS